MVGKSIEAAYDCRIKVHWHPQTAIPIRVAADAWARDEEGLAVRLVRLKADPRKLSGDPVYEAEQLTLS